MRQLSFEFARPQPYALRRQLLSHMTLGEIYTAQALAPLVCREPYYTGVALDKAEAAGYVRSVGDGWIKLHDNPPQTVRESILSALGTGGWVDRKTLQKGCQAAWGTVNQNLARLHKAGRVAIRLESDGTRGYKLT